MQMSFALCASSEWTFNSSSESHAHFDGILSITGAQLNLNSRPQPDLREVCVPLPGEYYGPYHRPGDGGAAPWPEEDCRRQTACKEGRPGRGKLVCNAALHRHV